MFKPTEIYQTTEIRKDVYKLLMENAAKTLNKAKIVANIKKALLLAKIIKKHHEAGPDSILDDGDMFGMFFLLMDCYDQITDEVAIIGAFENFAKSKLLRKQYVIHEFEPGEKGSDQRKRWLTQKTIPCHVRSCSPETKLQLKETTLSASILLHKNYCEKYGFSDECLGQLKAFNKARNSIHMNTRVTARITLRQIEAINELKIAIEQHLNKRGRRD